MSDLDTPKLDKYLLGRLSREETDALETRLLHDRRFFDLAESAEDDLIDRYVRGELAPDDAKAFERRLLASDRIRERVDVARSLSAWVDRRSRRGAATGADEEQIRGMPLFRQPARLAWAAALVAAIAAGALGVEVARLHDRIEHLEPAGVAVQAKRGDGEKSQVPAAAADRAPEQEPVSAGETESDREAVVATRTAERERLERELAAARERIASLESEPRPAPPEVRDHDADASAPSTATIFLALATRSAAGGEPLELGDAQYAEIHLELARRSPAGEVRATVSRGGEVVWQESGVEVESVEGETVARLLLPRQSLTDGRYRIELSEGAEGDEPTLLGTYGFSVSR